MTIDMLAHLTLTHLRAHDGAEAAESAPMDVRQLRQFLAVVDHGTVHRAAEHLFVAQPSVTQTIRRLESELGTDLFIRQGRGLVLSPAGTALVGPARDVVRALDVARETIAAVDGLRGGRLEARVHAVAGGQPVDRPRGF